MTNLSRFNHENCHIAILYIMFIPYGTGRHMILI